MGWASAPAHPFLFQNAIVQDVSERSDRACKPVRNENYDTQMTEVCGMEERSDDALCRAPAVPGILQPGKIVEGEKAAGGYEGAEPPVFIVDIIHPRKNERSSFLRTSSFSVGWMMGLEPTTLGTTIRCSTS